MTLLEKAIIIAVICHKGQIDIAGQPYILHPLRVMLKMKTDKEKIVAVLHDTIEDTHLTFNDLRERGFDEEIIDAINSVTKQEGESYINFVKRAKRNVIGRNVKIADIEDNLDLSRIPNPTEKDYKRQEKYKNAIKELLY